MMVSANIVLGLLGLLPTLTQGANLLVSHFSGSIYSLSLDPSSNSLAITSQLSGVGGMPSWITLDSDMLYVNDESKVNDPKLSALRVSPDNTVQVEGTAAGSLGQVHNTLYGGVDGKGFIAVAQYDLSAISTYALPIAADNSTTLLQTLTFNMSAPGPNASRQDRPHPHAVFTDPSGAFLLSPDLGADLVRIFRINDDGQLTACPAASSGPGFGPRHGAFWTGNGTSKLLMVNELDNSVSAWDFATVAASDGGAACLALTEVQTVSTYPASQQATIPDGSKAAEIHIAGDFVYVTNRGDKTFDGQYDSVATFAVDATTGALEFVDLTSVHGYFPRSFAINQAGDLVAFGGQTTSNVAVVRRDVQTGRLGELVASLQVGELGTDGGEDGLSGVVWNE